MIGTLKNLILIPSLPVLLFALMGCAESGMVAKTIASSNPMAASTPETLTNPPTTPAPIAPKPLGVSGNWSLKFQDEFSGIALDSEKWSTGPGDGAQYNYGYSNPNQVSVNNGILRLGIQKVSTTHWDIGSLNGRSQFSFLYGVMEVRMKVAKGMGFITAFWTLPTAGGWPPEIDVVEILGEQPSTAVMTYHWPNPHEASSDWLAGPDYSEGYHVFSVNWQPGSISWYVDGKLARQSFTDASVIVNTPMYLILGTGVGSPADSWTKAPDATTPNRAETLVDYVRVWQK